MTADPEEPGADAYRAVAFDALESGEHHAAGRWAKGWTGHGGVGHPEPWLVHVASALMAGQPKRATHAVDLALRYWLPGFHDRPAFTWLRGCIVRDRLRDPRTALADLKAAAGGLPMWIADEPDSSVAECEDLAARSRKRVASVPPRPEYRGAPAPFGDDPPTDWTRGGAFEPHVDGTPPAQRLRRVLADLGLPVLRD